MRPNRVFGLLMAFASGVGGFAITQSELASKRSHETDYGVEKRTFLFGKLVLVPVLAALGLKFLALVPIVLSKIAVLSVMNFLSTNLNLLVSTLFGLKNFLGKHGLWAHETTKSPSDWETFDWATIQPGLKYGYVPNEPVEGRIETSIKPPKMLKFYNGFGNGGYRWTYDRRTRPNDRSRLYPTKEQRSTEGLGKYKCYWTNEPDDLASKGLYVNKNNFDLSKTAIFKSPTYGGQLASYIDPSNSVDPTLENQMTLQTYYEYQPISSSTSEMTDQQLVPGKIDDGVSTPANLPEYDHSQPFTEAESSAV